MTFMKQVLFGTIGSSQTWSTGLWFLESGTDIESPPTQAQINTYAEAAWTQWKTSTVKSSPGILPFCGTNVTFLGVRCYWYRSSSQTAIVKGQSSSAAAVGTSSIIHPNQIAVCTSILTDTLGRNSRGRMYWPINAATQNADGTFSGAQASAISTAVANGISAVNLIDMGAKLFSAGVVSQKPHYNRGPVTGVRCDNVADTIRARRDKIVASTNAYTSVVVG